MVFFNWATMQMAAKIVYYGPGLCGKTSNLSYIYAKTTPSSRGEMVSLETESDRTLFFDLLPIEVGTIGGFKTRLQLYTVPGQVFYNTTRKLVLKGVDGLVFVADSQRPMREANVESFTSLVNNLEDLGLDMSDLPLVLQYNKRDLKNILTVDELNIDLNPLSRFVFHEASAINGTGVFETLKAITKLTLKKLRKRMATSQPGGVSPASEPVRPAMPAHRPESISAAALARAAEEGVVSNHPPNPFPAPQTPTRVAPPMPASPLPPPRPATQSDVFSPPPDQPEPIAIRGPLDGVDELPGRHVTPAPGGVGKAPPIDPKPRPAPGPAEQPVVRPAVTAVGAEIHLDPTEHVDFAQQSAAAAAAPPPVKRVHVSNQLDILAELEGLRAGTLAESPSGKRRSASAEIDIDSLISGVVGGTKKIRQRFDERLSSEVFDRMRGLEVAIRVKGADGETLVTLAPAVLEVNGIAEHDRLSIRFAVDLENAG
jgi:signal recognition particle receptor subunit beta